MRCNSKSWEAKHQDRYEYHSKENISTHGVKTRAIEMGKSEITFLFNKSKIAKSI